MGTTLLLRIIGALRTSQRALSFPGVRNATGLCSLIGAALVVAACGGSDGLTSPASVESFTRVFSVYALTGTSGALPAAYQFTTESLERPQVLASGAVNFDVAFDIGSDGKVRIFPARVIVPAPPSPAPVIGSQRAAQGFIAMTRAPTTGYLVDSVIVAGVNDSYVFELRSVGCIYGEPFYAKLAIDSIIPAERRIVVRSLVNRNCGFRALTEGLPKD